MAAARNVSTISFEIDCERGADGRWLAEVPQLPGLLAFGASANEACFQYRGTISWPSKAHHVYAALLSVGWQLKRQSLLSGLGTQQITPVGVVWISFRTPQCFLVPSMMDSSVLPEASSMASTALSIAPSIASGVPSQSARVV